MKKSLFLIFVFTLVFLSSLAAVNNGTIQVSELSTSSAKVVANYFDELGYKYKLDKLAPGRDDEIILGFDTDNTSMTIHIVFDSDNLSAQIWSWDLVTYKKDLQLEMITAVNKVNSEYRWFSFSADDDYTVTISGDMVFPEGDENAIKGIIAFYLNRMLNIGDEVYIDLMKVKLDL